MLEAKNNQVSLIICTYTRAESLRDTLNSLLLLDLKDINFELIVVDNNSKDNTKDVVMNFSKIADFPVKYHFEHRQGLSFARNTGIEQSSGEYLFFTDDDVIPEPDWIIKTLDGFSEFDCTACGGYIAPIWLGEKKPEWLSEIFYGFVAIKTDKQGPKQLDLSSDMPFGANMAFKRTVFEKYGLFNVERGRKGNNLASGEDGELFERLIKANESVYYFPDSKVKHKVEEFRQKKSYFRRWRYQASKNLAIVNDLPGKKRIFGIPLYLFHQMFRAIWTALIFRITKPEDEAFYKEMVVFHFFGTINGLFKRYK